MDAASITSAFIAAQMAQVQTAVAAKMVRMDADSANNAAKLLDAARQNMSSVANLAAGLGGNVDITV